MTVYSPTELEATWIKKWDADQLYQVPDLPPADRPPYYCLEMFPYPSGNLHVGHVRNYTIGDCMARFKRMKGFAVLHPFGFDAFGLPAENAAIKHQVMPQEWTQRNMDTMVHQLKRLGIGYAWNRQIATCDPTYYRHNQWLFLQLYRRGLVERRLGWVNWDPVDQTVLANEQVIDGRGWRSNALVEKRQIAQWVFKITDYAEELLAGLDHLPHWPERVKTMQRNWIGKRVGTTVRFTHSQTERSIDVFTTRPDTLFGVSAVVLSPDHDAIDDLLTANPEAPLRLEAIAAIRRDMIDPSLQSTDTMRVVQLDTMVVHPLTGAMVPVLVSDYVTMSFGSGAVMAVPAHDDRDYRLAMQCGLPVTPVIQHPTDTVLPMTEPGVLIDSGPYTGMSSAEATGAIQGDLQTLGMGGASVTYRLRDWLISRQRYWGTPIPMAYDEDANPVPIPEEQLPVVLPTDVQFGQGNPLASSPSFATVTINGQDYHRETDTMDTFVDSSWYFFRFTDPHCHHLPFRLDRAGGWMPVHQYIGGIEHAVLHLLYARFMTKVCRDLGLTTLNEPFDHLVCQGMVIQNGAKMSKSLGNVVEPTPIIDQYGADTLRVFILFGAPVERDLEWSSSGIEGAHRFLNRVWRLVMEPTPCQDEPLVMKALHATIKAVDMDINRLSFNTAIARLMELVNTLSTHGSTAISRRYLVQLLAPFAPMISDALWDEIGGDGSVHESDFPVYDEAWLVDRMCTVVIQVNGKLRDTVVVEKGITAEALEALARSNEKALRFISGIEVNKVIVVQNKLINFVGKPVA